MARVLEDGKILDPEIEVDDIIIEADPGDETGSVQKKINDWGRSIPVVKINDYVLQMDDVLSLNISCKIYSLPYFSMTVNDDGNNIKNALKQDIDKCTIFIGAPDLYIKFNGLILSVQYSTDGVLFVSGIFYNEPLYTRKQQYFEEKTVKDIITDICKETKLGLYVYDNDRLNFEPKIHVCPNQQQLQVIHDVVEKYTDNIWCIDTWGYLHIGNVKSILSRPVDKYTYNWNKKEFFDSPKDIIITFGKNFYSDETRDKMLDEEVQANSCKIESNFSKTAINFENIYNLYTDDGNITELDTLSEIGNNQVYNENTFYGFADLKFPLRTDRVNKMLCGNYITVELSRQPIYEITPFTNVILERYVYASATNVEKPEFHLDEEHSGKHFVFRYDFVYSRKDNNRAGDSNNIRQILYLI